MTTEAIKAGTRFSGYEYMDVTVNEDMESLYADGYQNFGWELEEASAPILNDLTPGAPRTRLKFKRERRIRNKAELTRLQRHFDSLAKEIVTLEQSKTTTAIITAFVIGVLGAGFTAGALFALLGGMTILGLVLAVPAVVGWTIPYLCYLKISKSRTEKVDPLIERKHDEIDGVCEKANGLLKT